LLSWLVWTRNLGTYPEITLNIHGFRAMARTILDEVLGFRPEFIDHQLAHAVTDPNGVKGNPIFPSYGNRKFPTVLMLQPLPGGRGQP
jgi:hypothetical protein